MIKKFTSMRTMILGATFMFAFTTSCTKERGCFDQALYQKHKEAVCTKDCPGVVGCDGKTYCNECIARTQGIRLR